MNIILIHIIIIILCIIISCYIYKYLKYDLININILLKNDIESFTSETWQIVKSNEYKLALRELNDYNKGAIEHTNHCNIPC